MTESSKTVGIQGGRGSFNEMAAVNNLAKYGIASYQLQYLHTTENVFKSLERDEIDYGQFAVRNSLGGEVEESVEAMKGRNFSILGSYKIKIAHALMISPKAQIKDIKTIITHPQVLRQCQNNLKDRYGEMKLSICQGELIDPARVAELLSEEKLPKSIATVSNKFLAQIHNLKIVAEDLQDSDDNFTTFLLVKASGPPNYSS